MKMVNDLLPHRTTSTNNLEENCITQVDNATNVDKSKGYSGAFPGDLRDSKCHNKDTDSVPMNHVILTDSQRYSFADSIERQIEAGSDDLVEPFGMCPRKNRAYEEDKVQSSIKDICIDEGVPVKDKILVEGVVDEGLKCVVEDSNHEWPVPVGILSLSVTDEACEKDFNGCESKVLILQSESESEATGLVSSNLLNEKIVDTVSVEETYAQEPLSKTSTEKSVAKEKSTPETLVEETANASRVETFNMIIEPAQKVTNNSSLPEAVNKNDAEVPSNASHPQILDASQPPEPQKLASENLTASAQLQRDHFESSFASVGPYTGSIPYSGSLSHRSDASTVSTRSFAFPVLQNEWNFSPVRMRKAERRHLRRHRGWMHGLFCCKF